MTDNDRLASKRKFSPEAAPTAPLWARVLAFLIDVIVLGVFWYAVWSYARPVVLALGEASLGVQLAIGLLYFWLLDGPLGGQTLGKMVMGLRTGAMGTFERLGLAPAAGRALVKVGPFLLIISTTMLRDSLDINFGRLALATMLYQLGLALLLANLGHMIISPAGRGLHDIWTGSLEGRDPLGAAMRGYLDSEEYKETSERVKPMQTAVLIFIVIAAMGFWEVYRAKSRLQDPEIERAYTFLRESQSVAEVDGVRPGFPAAFGGTTDDGLTTAALHLRYLYKKPVERDAALEKAREAATRLEDFWAGRGEDFQAIALQGRSDHQVREFRIDIMEAGTIFGFWPLMERVAQDKMQVRIPPDALINLEEQQPEAEATPGVESGIVSEDSATTPTPTAAPKTLPALPSPESNDQPTSPTE